MNYPYLLSLSVNHSIVILYFTAIIHLLVNTYHVCPCQSGFEVIILEGQKCRSIMNSNSQVSVKEYSVSI